MKDGRGHDEEGVRHREPQEETKREYFFLVGDSEALVGDRYRKYPGSYIFCMTQL